MNTQEISNPQIKTNKYSNPIKHMIHKEEIVPREGSLTRDGREQRRKEVTSS